jgi:hypothetical protein
MDVNEKTFVLGHEPDPPDSLEINGRTDCHVLNGRLVRHSPNACEIETESHVPSFTSLRNTSDTP